MKTNVKMTKLVRRVMTIAAAMLMVFTLFAAAVPAQAANVPVNGGTTTFNVYLNMPKDANVPNVTFDVSIVAGTAVVGNASALPIYAGIGSPTIGDAEFTVDQSTTAGESGTPDSDSVSKYATAVVTVGFSNISFPAPGVYRYNVSLVNPNVSGVSCDKKVLFLDVLVNDEAGDGTLEIGSYSLHEDGDTVKSDGFVNTYATQNLTLTKTVTGNQGDRDKYFEFDVKITNAAVGTKYDIGGTFDENAGQQTNPRQLTVPAGGTLTQKFYLKHGQSIVIKGLTSDADYEITETSYVSDGYTTTNTDNTSNGLTTGTKDMPASAHTVTFTNNRQGAVPTGVLLEIAPYIALAVVVIAGFVVLFATRRRRER